MGWRGLAARTTWSSEAGRRRACCGWLPGVRSNVCMVHVRVPCRAPDAKQTLRFQLARADGVQNGLRVMLRQEALQLCECSKLSTVLIGEQRPRRRHRPHPPQKTQKHIASIELQCYNSAAECLPGVVYGVIDNIPHIVANMRPVRSAVSD